MNNNSITSISWDISHFSMLGEENFNRLCLRLLEEEISRKIQPTNRKGPDNKIDAFLLSQNNNDVYGIKNSLCWFQFKYKNFFRVLNTGTGGKLKSDFKRDFKNELNEIIKKKNKPSSYLIVTNVELSGKDWSEWFEDEILKKYKSHIPFIECWDSSKLSQLLDGYPNVKSYFWNMILPSSAAPNTIIKTKSGKSNSTMYLLQGNTARFYEKLNFIIDFISNPSKSKDKNKDRFSQATKIIQQDLNLAWHFFRNLKSLAWFPEIKNNLIKRICEQTEDHAVKYKLLDYFDICVDKYSDEIIPLLIKLEKNTQDPNILVAIIKTISKLKPGKKENLKSMWRILEKLTEHQHSWVRKEIPGALKAFAKYNLNKSLSILKKLFLFNPAPRDITRGTQVLAVTFQGSDNENWVFEQAVKTLSALMKDKRFASDAFDLAIELEIHSIKRAEKTLERLGGITRDYSFIWLPANDKPDKVKYEYDRRKRFALEIQKCLNGFAHSDVKLARKLSHKLLQTNYEFSYSIAIQVLNKYPDEYLDVIENIVFNKDLWVMNIDDDRKYLLQTLIQKYFSLKKNRLSEYVQLVKSLKHKKGQEFTAYLKQGLLVSIPKAFKTKAIKQELKLLESKSKIEAKIEKVPIITDYSGHRPAFEISELKNKTDDGLVTIMEDCTAGRNRISSYNASFSFEKLIDDNPKRLPALLDKMIGKRIDQEFSGKMIKGYIEAKKSNLQDILNIFWKLQKTDNWAKVEVARLLDKECRKQEILQMDSKLLKNVKDVLFQLSFDDDPNDDEAIKSSNPRPEDAITRGINSIRGIATGVLVVLLHYFPKDKEITNRLKELAKDKTKTIKATLIYNLKYLITKDYALCKYIVNRFKNERDSEIDFSLIYYFSFLTPRKFQANKDFVKLLFDNPNAEIQKKLGELVGRRYADGFNLDELVEIIIKQRRGEMEARRSLAFVFESRLGEQIAIGKHKRIMKYFVKLLDPQSEPDFEVRVRAAFVFERDELQTKYFTILNKNKIFDAVLKDKTNVLSQSHLINYLHRCIIANKYMDQCINILYSQAMNSEGILGDQLIVQKISEILKIVLGTPKLNKKTKGLAEQIFDKGLERGWDEFYNIFHKLNKDDGKIYTKK